jgi:3-hydroxyacyl-CoA dehydrogenase
MGIFQLVDYVGLDVCQSILRVMNERLPGSGLHSPLIDRLLALGVSGGQFPDGSQKDGLLKYEKGRPAGVYDPDKKAYVPSPRSPPARPAAGRAPGRQALEGRRDADKPAFLEPSSGSSAG